MHLVQLHLAGGSKRFSSEIRVHTSMVHRLVVA